MVFLLLLPNSRKRTAVPERLFLFFLSSLLFANVRIHSLFLPPRPLTPSAPSACVPGRQPVNWLAIASDGGGGGEGDDDDEARDVARPDRRRCGEGANANARYKIPGMAGKEGLAPPPACIGLGFLDGLDFLINLLDIEMQVKE